jgi:hypothetical protein
LVFVDESSTNVALTPRYRRAPKGERAFGKALLEVSASDARAYFEHRGYAKPHEDHPL